MEENIHRVALKYNWPPGSWDHLSIARAARLFDAVTTVNDEERQAIENARNGMTGDG